MHGLSTASKPSSSCTSVGNVRARDVHAIVHPEQRSTPDIVPEVNTTITIQGSFEDAQSSSELGISFLLMEEWNGRVCIDNVRLTSP